MIRYIGESWNSHVRTADKVCQMIAKMDASIESVGEMTPELWSQLHDAQAAMEKAVALLTSYRDE